MSGESKTTTILFVDDSVTDRTRGIGLIRKAHADWHVLGVSGVAEALEVLAQRSINVVVSDLVMPGLDGRQFLRIMNRDYPLIPVVLITSQGDDQIAAECIGLGAVNYVPKRRLADDLLRVLNEVLLAEEELAATTHVLQHVVRNRCHFRIDSDLDQIRSLVNFVRERLHAMQMFTSVRVQNITTAVRESLLNAHFHGNLEVNSRPLELPRTEYLAVAAERRQNPKFAGRNIRLTMSLERGTISFRICDDGHGFDHSHLESLPEPPHEQFPNGNGVRQMRKLMETVSFNDAGNEVTLTNAVEGLSV